MQVFKIRRAAVVATALAAALWGGLLNAPAATAAPPPADPVILGANSGAAVAGQYIVKVKDSAALRSQGIAARARTLASGYHGKVGQVWDKALLGFAVSMSEAQARKLAADPDVAYVQQQQTYHLEDAEPGVPSWGLSRIDQRPGPADTSYNYSTSAQGLGIQAYVIDSGIHISNPDFGGRASYGTNTFDGTGNADDCVGHGTFVAGLIGGTKYGVAKQVNIVSVRAFDCNGRSGDTPIISALDWVVNHAVKPAVVNLSLGSVCTNGAFPPVVVPCPPGTSQGVVDAENRVIAAGIPLVTAAGNESADACNNPVGAAGGTINVASTRIDDTKSPSSDFGFCVDIWAPGENVWSVGGVGTDRNGAPQPDPRQDTGTSFAAPQVTGAVAVLLTEPQFSGATPARIAAALDQEATIGAISGLDAESPNKLLYVRPTSGTPVALAHNNNGRLALFGTNAGGSLFSRTQSADTPANSSTVSWTNWAQSTSTGWLSANAEPNQNGLLELAQLSTVDAIWHRQQTAVNGAAWTSVRSLDGAAQAVALADNANGRLEMFAVNRQGQISYRKQDSAGALTWGASTRLDFSQSAASVAAETDGNGLIEVLVADTHGKIWKALQGTASTDNWPVFTPVADPDNRAMNEIAVARDQDGRLELFGADGSATWYRAQTARGADSWTTWTQLGGRTMCHLTADAGSDGRVEVVGIDNQGSVWQSLQTSAGSFLYSGWAQIDGLLRP
jgi:Subtilase family/Peptidase inhibitor I9